MESLKRLYNSFTSNNTKKEEIKKVEPMYTRLKKSPQKGFKPTKKDVNVAKKSPVMEPIGYIKPILTKKKPVAKPIEKPVEKKASPVKRSEYLRKTIVKGLSNMYRLITDDTKPKPKPKVYAPPIVNPYPKKKQNVNYTTGHRKKASPPLKKGVQYTMVPNTPTVTKKPIERFNLESQPVSKGKQIITDYQNKFKQLHSIAENEKGISPAIKYSEKDKFKEMPMIMEEDLGISSKFNLPEKKTKKGTPKKGTQKKKEQEVKPKKGTPKKKEQEVKPKKGTQKKKELEKLCPEGKILNKLTGRCINAEGKTALALKTKK